MKRTLLLFAIFSIFASLSGQAPQGFNYQAVARDNNGDLITNTSLTVRAALSSGDALIWQEDHAVTTNDYGAFSLEIGSQNATKTGGSALAFNNIDWAAGNFTLEISINDGSGFTSVGASKLLSVPYALYAANASSGSDGAWLKNTDTIYTTNSVGIGTSLPNESLLSIQSSDPQVEKPLFEIKNDLGNPVFAVFNDGVMVYVDEDKKGVKGGFAVGGYSSGKKGVTQEYLRITPDSVRIWVPEDNIIKGVKGGFAVGGYNTASKTVTNNFLEVTKSNTSIFFDTTSNRKGFKGGFAVGGYNSGKAGDPNQLMSLTASNYLIGHEAGVNITDGRDNTFFGWKSGYNTTTGDENIFLGRFSAFKNTNGSRNVILGDSAGYSTTNGFNNIFVGKNAGFSNDIGDYNIFLGYRSGANHTRGISNIYIGDEAGSEADTSSNQVFIGDWAGAFASSGDNNILIGGQAGIYATLNNYNTFIGSYAGAYASGEDNAIFGAYSGYYMSGNDNVLIGTYAGVGSEGSEYSGNTYVGRSSGYNTSTGSDNVFLGFGSGYDNTDGSRNVFLGYKAGFYETGSDKLYIANSDTETPLVYGDFFNSNLKINGNAGINYDTYEGYGLIVDIPADQIEQYTIYSMGDVYATGDYYIPAKSANALTKSILFSNINAIEKVKQLNTGYFNTTAKTGESIQKYDIVAEDLENTFPELVKKDMKGNTAVNYNGLVPVLIEAVKEQQVQIETQAELIATQQEAIEELKKLFEAMK